MSFRSVLSSQVRASGARRLATAALAVVVIAGVATPSSATYYGYGYGGSRVLKVNCDQGRTIQSRLDRVRAGGTVEVSGTCTESVMIRTDRVTLTCTEGATITGSGAATTTISIRASEAVVSNCELASGDSTISVISVQRGGSARIEDNKIKGAGTTGVSIVHSSYGRLLGNEITGNVTGVIVALASGADISDNDITGNTGTGLLVTRAGAADIIGNRITGNGGSGIVITSTSSGDLSNDVAIGNAPNTISGNAGRDIVCSRNSSIRFGVPQNYGGGPPNIFISGGGFCATSGAF